MAIIQTEVDLLIDLVQKEEKISVKEAAKRIGVPKSTISEWASFLEEEGLINIEYRFTTPFLVKRKLNNDQITRLRDNVQEEKEIFDRKCESTLAYFTKLEGEVNSLKDLFNDLRKHFKKRISEVKEKFGELRKAEEEKKKLDEWIIESKQKFIKQTADLNKKLLQEQADNKKVYGLLYDSSQIESQMLGIQKDELELIKNNDDMLNKKLKKLRKRINKKESKRRQKKEKKLTSKSEVDINIIEKKYTTLRDNVNKEKQIMEDLLEKNKKQEKQIDLLKNEVLSKIKASNSKLDKTINEVETVPRKIKMMMHKKDKILNILNGISYNEKMLKEKLAELMKKGSALNLIKNSEDATIEIKELEKNLEQIANKKGIFETEVKKIFRLLK